MTNPTACVIPCLLKLVSSTTFACSNMLFWKILSSRWRSVSETLKILGFLYLTTRIVISLRSGGATPGKSVSLESVSSTSCLTKIFCYVGQMNVPVSSARKVKVTFIVSFPSFGAWSSRSTRIFFPDRRRSRWPRGFGNFFLPMGDIFTLLYTQT